MHCGIPPFHSWLPIFRTQEKLRASAGVPGEGIDCGDTEQDQRYGGVCDKDGCDFNSWRLGVRNFYGRGQGFEVNSRKPLTVVTQFITEGNTDSGALVDIRRFYVQDGQVIPNSNVSIAGVSGNSITDKFCKSMKTAFDDVDDFEQKGGLKSMGEALDRGWVLFCCSELGPFQSCK